MSRRFKVNKPIRKPAHWSKERYDKYLKDFAKSTDCELGGKNA